MGRKTPTKNKPFFEKSTRRTFLKTFLKEKDQMPYSLLPQTPSKKCQKKKWKKMDAVAAESGQGGRAHGENEKRIK